jgi:peptidoglycan/xylan/chitin deacetylase (PgdA/CDA1 family)
MKKNQNLCLNYHDFSGTKITTYRESKYTVDFRQFIKQLDLLSNYENVELIKILLQQEHTLFNYSLTFDDGYKSCLYIAEELAKRSVKGTFFIIRDRTISNNKYLSTSDLKELDLLGMEVGSHTCTHKHMNRLENLELKLELRDSKNFIEDVLSKPVYSISFPGGHCGQREFEAAKNEGYLLYRTSFVGLNPLPLQNGIVRSITITDKINIETYRKILDLSSFYFAKAKLRELSLSPLKLIESRYISSKY